MSETKNTHKTEISTKVSTHLVPLCHLIVLNDDINTMDYVATTLHEVLPLTELEAQLVMIEAHKTGASIALTEPLEHAELHQEKLIAKLIVSAIEPA